jgi:hypothetical protein
MKRAALAAGIVLLVGTLAVAGDPDRAKGISMHLLPKGVADLGGQKWGLTITPTSYLTPDARSITLQTVDEFLAFVQKQSPSVKENGVWIVTTHPDAYSDAEKSFLNGVIAACGNNGVLLFVARASELPNGWKRYPQAH